MQCPSRSKTRSRGLDTVFRYTPDLLGRRSLPYLNRIVAKPVCAKRSLPCNSVSSREQVAVADAHVGQAGGAGSSLGLVGVAH